MRIKKPQLILWGYYTPIFSLSSLAFSPLFTKVENVLGNKAYKVKDSTNIRILKITIPNTIMD